MPLLHISSTPAGLRLQDGSALAGPLDAALDRGQGPVLVMVHGYSYLPGSPRRCPHRTLFAKAAGWPSALSPGADALTIGFGWPARGSIWRAWQRAAHAGTDLADLVAALSDRAPGRAIALIGHSLGARVIATALLTLDRPCVDRVILMAGAEFAATMRAALDGPGGQGASLLNVTSRQNDLYDRLLAWTIRPGLRRDRPLGQGLHGPRVTTLQIDCPETLRALALHGFAVANPTRRISHWSVYRRPGILDVYRAFLSGTLPLATFAPTRSPLRRAAPCAAAFVPEPPAA